MANKKIGSVLVVAAVALASYWYFSPYISIHQMRTAARAGDAETFNAHVDYPKLRENIKQQFSSMLGNGSPARAGSSDGAENPGAAFGKMIGFALVDRMIDGMLRPEFVMKAMKDGKWGARSTAKPGAEPDEKKDPQWTSERQGLNKFIVHLHGGDSALKPDETGFVFERVGFSHWALIGIRLPAIDKR